ncbi:hypothetical protein LMG27198_20160 [Methylocystis echinoides]|uniref:Uncharacterized protein n=2 Tax=Methylocystis echinoides TaxID=29468 RepID=A0A9W6LS64_9HYPH|nr:hypothetical protein LMG27198_20160 [Methylocystis echinoides]
MKHIAKIAKRVKGAHPTELNSFLETAVGKLAPKPRSAFCLLPFTQLATAPGLSSDTAKLIGQMKNVAVKQRVADIQEFFGLKVELDGKIARKDEDWLVCARSERRSLPVSQYPTFLGNNQVLSISSRGVEYADTCEGDWPRMEFSFVEDGETYVTRGQDFEDSLRAAEKFAGSKKAVTVLSRLLLQESLRSCEWLYSEGGPERLLKPAKRTEGEMQLGNTRAKVSKSAEGDFEIIMSHAMRTSSIQEFRENIPPYSLHPNGDEYVQPHESLAVTMSVTLIISGQAAHEGEIKILKSVFERSIEGKIPMPN